MTWFANVGIYENGYYVMPFPDEDGTTPLDPIQVDYINRPSGVSAGPGDVFISHLRYFPVDEDVDVIDVEWGLPDGYRLAFGGYQFDNLPRGIYQECHIAGASFYQIIGRSEGQWEVTAGALKFREQKGSYPTAFYVFGDLYYFSSKDEAESHLGEVQGTVSRLLGHCTKSYIPTPPPGYRVYSSITPAVAATIAVKGNHSPWQSALDSFIEARQWLGYSPVGASGVPAGLFQKAYQKAVEKLPALHQNFFANIVDFCKLVASFKKGYSGLRSVKDTLSDLWLQYRYSYRTTISDAEELSNAAARLLASDGSHVASYGVASKGDYTVYVAIGTTLHLPSDVNSLCRACNFRPTLANIWDVIPYSFIVDWFLGIGSCLEDLQTWLDGATIPVDQVWYSAFHQVNEPGVEGLEYCRFSGGIPSIPYISDFKLSDNSGTWTMRAFDALALIV